MCSAAYSTEWTRKWLTPPNGVGRPARGAGGAQRADALDRAPLHADAELDVDPRLNLVQAHRIAHDAEHELTHAVPKLTTALIHAYPAEHDLAAPPGPA